MGSDHAPMRIVNVAFRSAAWRRIRARYFAAEPDWFELAAAKRVWPVDARALALLNHWSERLAAGHRPAVDLDGFLMDLPHLRPAGAQAPAGPLPGWLARMQRQLARPEVFAGGTPALARAAGRSPSHLARAVRHWFGRTPTDLLNEARLDYSARQLTETSRPIIDIMLDCGLNNLSHFYALFRHRHGMSPRRYRLQARPTYGVERRATGVIGSERGQARGVHPLVVLGAEGVELDEVVSLLDRENGAGVPLLQVGCAQHVEVVADFPAAACVVGAGIVRQRGQARGVHPLVVLGAEGVELDEVEPGLGRDDGAGVPLFQVGACAAR
jgi:AraC-like DNA-binding protein